jgi:glycerol-3-phosphate acyltransferase PlsY
MSNVSEIVVGVALIVAAYFAGSFPTASAVGMLSGHDHSKEGSGNPGASNVYRTSGAAYGIVTVVVDLMKGFVPVLATLLLLGRPWAAGAWAAATIGHVIPFARWRNGGKGVATGGGGSIPLYPYVGLVLVLVFIVSVKLTRRASVGSLSITILLVAGAVVLQEHVAEIAASVVVAGVVIYRHRSNIGRLLSGEELRVR